MMEESSYVEYLVWGSIASFVAIFFLSRVLFTKTGLPPGPKGWPIIGNMDVMGGKLLHKDLALLSAQYGPFMYLKLGSRPALVVSSIEGAKEAFKTNDKVFGNRADIEVSRTMFYGTLAFVETGEYWKQMRKIATQELLASHKAQSWQGDRMEEIANAMREISLLLSLSSSLSKAEAVNINDVGERIVSRFMGRLLASKDLVEESAKMKTILDEIMKAGSRPMIGDLIPYLGFLDIPAKKRIAGIVFRWRNLVRHMIALRQEKCRISASSKDPPECFLDILIKLRAQGQLVDSSDAAIGGIILDLFGAGIETSSTTLEWTMVELMRNPEKLQKVREEIDREVTRGAPMVEDKDLGKLTYLKAVVKETLRLHPPAPFLLPRQSLARCVVGGGRYEVPDKTLIYINVWAIGRDPNVWEQPLLFMPERFCSTCLIEGNNNNNKRDVEHNLLSFGGGRRNCPGMAMGLTSIELILANLLHGFEWKLSTNPSDGSTIDMGEKYSIVALKKETPLLLIPTLRHNA